MNLGALIHQSQVRFVDESRRLQEVPGPLPPKAGRRPAAEFLMNQTNQFVPRNQIAPTPRLQQACQVVV